MARDAHDREDLLREARGLSPRAELELALPDGPGEIFVGYRRESLSLYFGQDLAFHFNARGELRRAFAAELLLKADAGRLVAMRRERTETESLLVSRVLDDAATAELLGDLQRRLRNLAELLAANRYRFVGEVPANSGVVEKLQTWLANQTGPMVIAAAPHVG